MDLEERIENTGNAEDTENGENNVGTVEGCNNSDGDGDGNSDSRNMSTMFDGLICVVMCWAFFVIVYGMELTYLPK